MTLSNKRMSPARDLWRGVRSFHVWKTLGQRDYLRQYSGTLFGPLWTTFGNLLFVFGIAWLFSNWSEQPFAAYLGHVALGFTLWTAMSRTVNESANCFIAARPLINEIPLPMSLHVFRSLWKIIIGFSVDFAAMLIIIFAWGITFAPEWWWGAAGYLLVLAALPGYGLLMATVGVSVRSILPLVELTIRFAFFFTPIIWMLTDNRIVFPGAEYNPFAVALAVSRDGLLHGPPAQEQWVLASGIFAFGWIAGLTSFVTQYRRLPLLAVRG